jgi:hypothetical protein
MKQVWDNVVVASDGKTLTWNLTGDKLATFDDSCVLYFNSVYLTLRLSIPIRDSAGVLFTYDVTLSNNAAVTTAIHQYLPMRIVNSCLAEGGGHRIHSDRRPCR